MFQMLIGEYLFYKNLNGQSSTMPIGCVNFPWVTFAYEKVKVESRSLYHNHCVHTQCEIIYSVGYNIMNINNNRKKKKKIND